MTNLERWRATFPIVELERPPGFRTHQRTADALERISERLTLGRHPITPIVILPTRYLPRDQQGSYDPTLNVIRINLSAQFAGLTTVHEIAHALDAQSEGVWASNTDEAWQERIRRSAALLRLERFDRNTYFRRSHELFARFTEQWFADAFPDEWRAQAVAGIPKGLYWTDTEFHAIRPAFERTLRHCGVQLKRTRTNPRVPTDGVT
jgi:hypothetical protein